MRANLRTPFAGLLLTLVAGVTGFAETVHDFRTWANITAQGHVGASHWRWYFDVQERNRDTSSDADQFVVRPAVGYALNATSTVWAGYAYTANFMASGDVLNENRTWEQYLWSGLVGRATLSARSRAEQRFFEGADNVGWRARPRDIG